MRGGKKKSDGTNPSRKTSGRGKKETVAEGVKETADRAFFYHLVWKAFLEVIIEGKKGVEPKSQAEANKLGEDKWTELMGQIKGTKFTEDKSAKPKGQTKAKKLTKPKRKSLVRSNKASSKASSKKKVAKPEVKGKPFQKGRSGKGGAKNVPARQSSKKPASKSKKERAKASSKANKVFPSHSKPSTVKNAPSDDAPTNGPSSEVPNEEAPTEELSTENTPKGHEKKMEEESEIQIGVQILSRSDGATEGSDSYNEVLPRQSKSDKNFLVKEAPSKEVTAREKGEEESGEDAPGWRGSFHEESLDPDPDPVESREVMKANNRNAATALIALGTTSRQWGEERLLQASTYSITIMLALLIYYLISCPCF